MDTNIKETKVQHPYVQHPYIFPLHLVLLIPAEHQWDQQHQVKWEDIRATRPIQLKVKEA